MLGAAPKNPALVLTNRTSGLRPDLIMIYVSDVTLVLFIFSDFAQFGNCGKKPVPG